MRNIDRDCRGHRRVEGGIAVTTYWITAVRRGKCVVLHRGCVASAMHTVARLRTLGWEAVVSP